MRDCRVRSGSKLPVLKSARCWSTAPSSSVSITMREPMGAPAAMNALAILVWNGSAPIWSAHYLNATRAYADVGKLGEAANLFAGLLKLFDDAR